MKGEREGEGGGGRGGKGRWRGNLFQADFSFLINFCFALDRRKRKWGDGEGGGSGGMEGGRLLDLYRRDDKTMTWV